MGALNNPEEFFSRKKNFLVRISFEHQLEVDLLC